QPLQIQQQPPQDRAQRAVQKIAWHFPLLLRRNILRRKPPTRWAKYGADLFYLFRYSSPRGWPHGADPGSSTQSSVAGGVAPGLHPVIRREIIKTTPPHRS